MSFCPYCGKELTNGELCSCSASKTVGAGKLGKINIKKLAIPVFAAIVVIIALVLVISHSKSRFDLSDYIVIEGVTGLNTRGVLEYELDDDSLIEAMLGNFKTKEITEDNFEKVMSEELLKYEEIDEALSCITIEASKSEHLSNGDKVVVTAKFSNPENKKISYTFKEGSVEYTVSGLKDGQSIDPFSEEYVSLTFSGIDTLGHAEFTQLSFDGPLALFSYSLSKRAQLCNGDTITLSVKYNEKKLTEMGYFLEGSDKKEIIVSGLDEGITIDPFSEENISVVFSGVSGNGSAYIDIVGEDEAISYFRYSLSNSSNLSNGDVIRVSASANAYDLMELGYVPPVVTEKTITVSGLGEAYDFSSGLPEDVLQQFCNKAIEYAKAEEQRELDYGFNVTVPTVIHKAYSLSSKDGSLYYDWAHNSSCINAVIIVTSYSIDFGVASSGREEWQVWVFPDFSIDAAGTLSYNSEEECIHSLLYSSFDGVYEWICTEYKAMDIAEIPLD